MGEELKITIKAYVDDLDSKIKFEPGQLCRPVEFDQNITFITENGCYGMILTSNRHINAPNKTIYFEKGALESILKFLIENK